MTMSKLVKNSHESFPYNRNMAHALYRSTFLENWGSGIHRIVEACQEQGVEEPTWRLDGAFVYVTFKRPTKQGSNTDQALNNVDPSSPETEQVHQKTDSSSPERSLETIISSPEFINSSSDHKVLMLLNYDSRLTLEKMAEHLSMTKRGVQKITNRLQESGALSREGSTKAGEWIVNNKN